MGQTAGHYAASLESVREAADRIAPFAHVTQVSSSLRASLPAAQHGSRNCVQGFRGLQPPDQCRCIVQVLTCSTLDALAGHQLFFKCELFQRWCGGTARSSAPDSPSASCSFNGTATMSPGVS